MKSSIAYDSVTLGLLGLTVLLVALPGAFLVLWRATRPPFGIVSFRWLYAAWACLLVAGSVWTINRDPRFSVQEVGADNYVRLAFLTLGALLILAIGAVYRYTFLSEFKTATLGSFLVFALWGLASTLWSVFPAGTLIKACEYGTMLALFALTASVINLTMKDAQSRLLALKSVFDFGWFLIFVLIASVYLDIVVWPEYALNHAWRNQVGVVGFSINGVLPGIQDNAVGQLGAMLGVVAFVRILLKPRSRAFYVPIFVLCLITMVLAQSRSPVLAFSLAIIAVLIASRRLGLLVLSGAIMVGVMLTQYGQVIYDFMRRGQSVQLLTSLTGRVEYWQASLQAFQDRPLGGYGANVGGRYVLQAAFGLQQVATVHNTWVEVLVDTGTVGVLLFSVGLGITCFRLLRLRSIAMRVPMLRMLWLESLGVLTVLCVRSMFSVDFVWSWQVLTFGLILIFISVVGRQVADERYAGAHGAQPLPATRRRRSGVRG